MPLIHIFVYLVIGCGFSVIVDWEDMEASVEQPIPIWIRVMFGALWPVLLVVIFLRLAVGR